MCMRLALLILTLTFPACSPAGGGTTPRETPFVVFPADADLEAPAKAAAKRIAATAGIEVEVSTKPAGAVPLFWMNRDVGLYGLCDDGPRADWAAVDRTTPAWLVETVVLHELLHALGARHVDNGEGLLLSAHIGAPQPIRSADLEALCLEAECLRFVPEQ